MQDYFPSLIFGMSMTKFKGNLCAKFYLYSRISCHCVVQPQLPFIESQ